VIDELERWYEAHAHGLGAAGLHPGFGRSVGERPDPSACVTLETAVWSGEVRVWESGDAELRAMTRGAGLPEIDEHHHLAAREDLELLLARLTEHARSD
jgi:hypothetical protein